MTYSHVMHPTSSKTFSNNTKYGRYFNKDTFKRDKKSEKSWKTSKRTSQLKKTRSSALRPSNMTRTCRLLWIGHLVITIQDILDTPMALCDLSIVSVDKKMFPKHRRQYVNRTPWLSIIVTRVLFFNNWPQHITRIYSLYYVQKEINKYYLLYLFLFYYRLKVWDGQAKYGNELSGLEL